MSEKIYISSINFNDFELLFENVSFPLTKAELIRKAKMESFPASLFNLINNLPARFYHSRNEVLTTVYGKACVLRLDNL